MAEFERIPVRPRPNRRWLPNAALAFAAFVVLMIVKPWDTPSSTAPGQAGAGGATPLPTFYIAPTARTGPRPYDPALFGGREPDPAWELWPAGYVVQFGLAGPVKVGGPAGGSLAPSVSAGPDASPDASPLGSPAGESTPLPSGRPDAPALPSDVIDLGPTDHLVALGINTPLDARIELVSLWRVEAGGLPEPIGIVLLPTLWESRHFIVIAPEDPAAPGQATGWEPGVYRLDLTSATLETREVILRVSPAQS
jgi:hypothetical protein